MEKSQVNETHYTKLKTGGWGLWIPGADAVSGDTIKVATKAGKVKTETVGRVIYRGTKDGQAFCVCTIEGKEGAAASQDQQPQQPADRTQPAPTSNQPSSAAGTFFCPCCGEKLGVTKL